MEEVDFDKKVTIQSFEPIKNDWISQSGLNQSVFEKEVSFAIQILIKNPYLQKATRSSIMRAVMNIAQVGLTLNPVSKYAYLVPRYNKQLKCLEAVLDPSYQGYVKLLTDSGVVVSIQCNLFYEGDLIEVDFASNEKINKHIPYYLNGKDKGNLLGCYSKATLKDGSKHIEIMTISDIYEVRERSESYKSFKDNKTNSCIWESDLGEMCRKTVIKRHYKYLPKSSNSEKIDKAIQIDNDVNGYKPSIGKVIFIDSLIHNSLLDDEVKARIENSLDTISEHEIDSLIKFLQENQKPDMNQQLDQAIRRES